MDVAIQAIFQLAVLIFSIVIHEVSHGLTANVLGDPTAKYAGRLTLNPMKHLDPVGSLFVPLVTYALGGMIIGWAKPVPYNPNLLRLHNQEFGSALVGIAGPLANITVALVFGLFIRLFGGFNFAAPASLIEILSTIVFINLVLAVFNLVPLPPLDGSKVLFFFLPPALDGIRMFLEQFGFIILILFIVYFSGWILPIVIALFRLITGGLTLF